MTSAVRASCGLYKMLLFAYPSDFRLRFGSEMVTTFSDLICGEWEHNGPLGVARVWRSVLREVFFLPLCHFTYKAQLWLRPRWRCFRRLPCSPRYFTQ